MGTVFSFFLRLFLCLAAARLLLQAIGVAGRDYLMGLTLLFLANVYWFSYLVFRDRSYVSVKEKQQPSAESPAPAAEPGEPGGPGA
jgi:hypothetical protein